MRKSKKVFYMFCCVSLFVTTTAIAQKDWKSENITICHLSSDDVSHSHILWIIKNLFGDYFSHCDYPNACVVHDARKVSSSPLAFHVTDAKCYGDSSASINVTLKKKKKKKKKKLANYKFLWSTGDTTKDISGLASGIYYLTATRQKARKGKKKYKWKYKKKRNKVFIDSVFVGEPNPLLIQINSTEVTCANPHSGSVSVLASGGVSPYQYLWTNPDDTVSYTADSVSGLMAGTYNLMVSDSNLCTAQLSTIVGEEECGLTQVSEAYCGGEVTDLSSKITCDPVEGAQNYQWKFTHTSSGFQQTYNRGNNMVDLALTWITGLQYGKTYQVSVKAMVDGVWSDFGAECEVTVPAPIPPTQVISSQCGGSVVDLNSKINCDPVAGAQNYQWEFAHPASGFSEVFNRGNDLTFFSLTWINGLQYGKTYEVRVKAMVGGVWGDFGPVCEVTVPAPIPSTQVTRSQCGSSFPATSSKITCDPVAGAQNYQWEFADSTNGFLETYVQGNNVTTFSMAWIPGLQNGGTYEVRVKSMVGGEWSVYGPICQITISSPSARLSGAVNANGSLIEKALIFPNPTNGETINVALPDVESTSNAVIQIWDVTGRELYQQQSEIMPADNNVVSIQQADHFPPGTYYLTLSINDQLYQQQFIVY